LKDWLKASKSLKTLLKVVIVVSQQTWFYLSKYSLTCTTIEGSRQDIKEYLKAPDQSQSLIDAQNKRDLNDQTTGTWFINSDQFFVWKETPNSILWLYGIRKFIQDWSCQ